VKEAQGSNMIKVKSTNDNASTIIKFKTPQDLTATYKEAKLLFGLGHPNIIRARDIITRKSDLGINYEFADAGSLEEMIKYRKTWGPPFTEAECMKYFAQLVLAFK
jgi:serine/threonine protein kinase